MEMLVSIEQIVSAWAVTLMMGRTDRCRMRVSRVVLCSMILFAMSAAFSQEQDQIKVKADYDHKANFGEYKTFMWLREPATVDPQMRRPVVAAVNAQLIARG